MIVAVVVFLSGWLVFAFTGEKGRVVRCSWNLSAMGKAMDGYAGDHGGALPAAGINVAKLQVSWDTKLIPYLAPKLAKENSGRLFAEVPRHFLCPSDQVTHNATPRSYAMPVNDMQRDNWPPGKDSSTGVGLYWTESGIKTLLGDAAAVSQNSESLPALKLPDVPSPASTILVTELIAPDNLMGSVGTPSVAGVDQQRRFLGDRAAQFHAGRFNYLMVDGHVEWLSPLQTGSFDGTSGLWSLKKGD